MRNYILTIAILTAVFSVGCGTINPLNLLTKETTQEVVNAETGAVTKEVVVEPSTIANVAIKAVSLAPFPYAETVGGILSTALLGFAGHQTRKKKWDKDMSDHQKTLQIVASAINTVGESELGRTAIADLKKKVNDKVKKSGLKGVIDEVIKTVA